MFSVVLVADFKLMTVPLVDVYGLASPHLKPVSSNFSYIGLFDLLCVVSLFIMLLIYFFFNLKISSDILS